MLKVATKQEDPIKTATLEDVLLSSELLVPFKKFSEKKKEPDESNSSFLASIAGVSPLQLNVNDLRHFCVGASI